MIVTRHLHSPIVFAQKGQSKIISSDLLQDTVFRRQHSPFIARSRRRRTIQRSQTVPAAALQFSAVPLEAIVAGATAITGGLAALIWGIRRGSAGGNDPESGSMPQQGGLQAPREEAVLVFGSTGKLGRQIVAKLLAAGKTVVAAARDTRRAEEVFGELGFRQGFQDDQSQGMLAIEGGVDITNPKTLSRHGLWDGVTQVVCAVGPVFGRLPNGKMGYLDGLTSERVDAAGVANIAETLKAVFKDRVAAREAATVLQMASEADLALWERLDDVIMGGQSSSTLRSAADIGGADFSGDLIVEGGGFCGARTKALDLNLGDYDGIALEVEGDGQTYKLNLKTADQEDVPECTFQATFDTTAGRSTMVYLPWRAFVPVKRARVDPTQPKLDPSRVRQLGLVLSRFEFNGLANPNYRPGKFSLKIKGGVQGFREPRPAVVLVTSAGVERNAKIGDDEAARKADIPIVQLNPGGVLNHKYAGEWALRSAGLPYAVVRSTGLTSEDEDVAFLLEASQGDRISGKISRKEVAAVAVTALGTAASVGKTIEVRRSEATGDRGKAPGAADLERLFLTAVEDRHRPLLNLAPLPAPVPPPKPPTPERTAEILSDERVQAARAAGRGGRVRDEAESAAASSVTVVGDGRADVSSPGQNGAGKPQAAADGDASVSENVQEARDWIRAWRARSLESKVPQKEKAGVKS